MALTFDEINTFCRSNVVPKIVNNVIQSNAVVYRLFKKARKWNGGTYHETPIFWEANPNAESYAGATQLSTAVNDEVTKTQFAPRQYNVAVKLTGIELAENKGDAKVLDLVKEKMKIAETSLKNLFGTHLFTAQTGTNIDALPDTCAALTAAYGGIDPADVTTWESSAGSTGKGGGPDSATTSLTRTALNKHFNACKIDEDKPTLLATTDDIMAGIEATFVQPNMRYVDKDLARLGFESFKYKSCDVVTSSKISAGDLWMLNENHLYFAIFPGMNFKFIPFATPVDYDYKVSHIRWYGNLICDSRWSQGWMSAITGVA